MRWRNKYVDPSRRWEGYSFKYLGTWFLATNGPRSAICASSVTIDGRAEGAEGAIGVENLVPRTPPVLYRSAKLGF